MHQVAQPQHIEPQSPPVAGTIAHTRAGLAGNRYKLCGTGPAPGTPRQPGCCGMCPCPPVPGDLILFFPQISAQGSKPVYVLLYNIEAAPSLHPQNDCRFHSRDNRTALTCPEADGEPKAPASLETPPECCLLLDRLNVFTKHKIVVKRVEQGKKKHAGKYVGAASNYLFQQGQEKERARRGIRFKKIPGLSSK